MRSSEAQACRPALQYSAIFRIMACTNDGPGHNLFLKPMAGVMELDPELQVARRQRRPFQLNGQTRRLEVESCLIGLLRIKNFSDLEYHGSAVRLGVRRVGFVRTAFLPDIHGSWNVEKFQAIKYYGIWPCVRHGQIAVPENCKSDFDRLWRIVRALHNELNVRFLTFIPTSLISHRATISICCLRRGCRGPAALRHGADGPEPATAHGITIAGWIPHSYQ